MRSLVVIALLAGAVGAGCARGEIGDPTSRARAPQPAKPTTTIAPQDDDDTPVAELAPAQMRRLTQAQYLNTLDAVFGPGLHPNTPLPEDSAGEEVFVSVRASRVGSSRRDVAMYHAAALDVARQIVARRQALAVLDDCYPTSGHDSCLSEVVRHYGRLLWRHTLTDAEVNHVLSSIDPAHTSTVVDAPELRLQFVIATLLASPDFLFVRFAGELDDSGERRYTSTEMAHRIALLLLDRNPGDDLIAAGERGELVDPIQVARHTRELLRQHGGDVAVRFVFQNWNVQGLAKRDKDVDAFPMWTPALIDAAEEEMARGVRRAARRDGDFHSLFVTRTSEINGTLAPLYDVAVEGDDFEEVTLPTERSGMLTSVAVMGANAKPGRTSPTQRGVFLRSRVLCLPVPGPPEDVVDGLEQGESSEVATTLRQRLQQHRDNPGCAYCHQLFDPMGFSLEGFDAVGRYRTHDRGQPIDTRATFEEVSLDNARELGEFLFTDPRADRCTVERFFTFAAGHSVRRDEQPMIDELTRRFREGGRSFHTLVTLVTTSRGFRYMTPHREVCP